VSFAACLLAKAAIRRLFVVNWDSCLVGVVAWCDLPIIGGVVTSGSRAGPRLASLVS
jgi:hypothetical protein